MSKQRDRLNELGLEDPIVFDNPDFNLENFGNMSKQRDKLIELGLENAIVFDNPNFDTAIIGNTDDGRVVYDFETMVHQLCEDENMSYEEAVEFIECNTIRTIPYIGENAPVIVYNTLEF